jgi:hypothetical protein
MRKPLIWTVAVLAALALAWMLLARDGGCDRTPPDDDEPVPACKPTDKECLGAEPEKPAV